MNIRSLYLYLFSFIGLLIAIIGTVQIVDLVLTVYVFDEADRYEYFRRPPLEPGSELDPAKEAEYEEELREQNERDVLRQRQRRLSSAISMIVVGIPVYLYHWRIISGEAGAKKKT